MKNINKRIKSKSKRKRIAKYHYDYTRERTPFRRNDFMFMNPLYKV